MRTTSQPQPQRTGPTYTVKSLELTTATGKTVRLGPGTLTIVRHAGEKNHTNAGEKKATSTGNQEK